MEKQAATLGTRQPNAVEGTRMDAQVHVSALDCRHWPTYRTRRNVLARRLGTPTWVDGTYWRDGYLVRGVSGGVVVVSVAEFEAVYELAGMNE